MSKTKRALPEDFSVLRGDELDGEPSVATLEPSEADHQVNELTRAITALEKLKPYGYYTELDTLSARLSQLVSDLDKPF